VSIQTYLLRRRSQDDKGRLGWHSSIFYLTLLDLVHHAATTICIIVLAVDWLWRWPDNLEPLCPRQFTGLLWSQGPANRKMRLPSTRSALCHTAATRRLEYPLLLSSPFCQWQSAAWGYIADVSLQGWAWVSKTMMLRNRPFVWFNLLLMRHYSDDWLIFLAAVGFKCGILSRALLCWWLESGPCSTACYLFHSLYETPLSTIKPVGFTLSFEQSNWRCLRLDIRTGYWGLHDEDIPPHPPNQGLFWAYLTRVFHTPLLALVKISALLFILRLGRSKTSVRRFCKTLLLICTLQLIVFFPITVFKCRPIEKSWTLRGDGQCLSHGAVTVILACFNIATDIFTIVIPFVAFHDLKVPNKIRYALLAVFTLGGL